jgi:hypothetical protein
MWDGVFSCDICLDAVEPGADIEKCPFWICGGAGWTYVTLRCMIVRGCCGICIGFVNVHLGIWVA